MRLNAAAASHPGPRPNNQDAAFAAPWGAVVADGVGGGPAGDLASASIVHRLAAGRLVVVDEDALHRAVQGANWELWAHIQREPALSGMATTLTGLMTTTSDGLLLVHSGDSRAYRLRDRVLTRQTRDDSYVQALVDHGLIGPDEASTHPRRNLVTASLGGGDEDGFHVWVADAAVGDRWLLCSDGVSDYVPDGALSDALRESAAPASAADAVVRVALEAGTRDNVTAVVCDVLAGAPMREEARFAGAALARFAERLDDAS